MRITPGPVSGTVAAIPSKSAAQRLLLCAALCTEPTDILCGRLSEDIEAAMNAAEALGCLVERTAAGVRVTPRPDSPAVLRYGETNGAARRASEHAPGGPASARDRPRRVLNPPPAPPVFQCGESGTLARFLLPVAAALFDGFTLTGAGTLVNRSFGPLRDALQRGGCVLSGDRLPVTGRGRLCAGRFEIPGNFSSQFISGLLYALPLLSGDSVLRLTAPLESAPYVDMTLKALAKFGVEITRTPDGFETRGGQRYVSPGAVQAEGDWSNAAFFLCMGALGGPVTVTGLDETSAQGDRAVTEILRRFGARADGGAVKRAPLKGVAIDAAQIPDLIPALAAVAAVSEGETRIVNAARLRLKESDRLASVRDMLTRLGADAEVCGDGMIIRGQKRLRGGAVDAARDHRIVMAAATAACACENPVIIRGCEAVGKSYPGFFEDFRRLGGDARAEG